MRLFFTHPLPPPNHRGRARERRQAQEALDKQRTLGEGGEDVDDLGAWVERNRKLEASGCVGVWLGVGG